LNVKQSLKVGVPKPELGNETGCIYLPSSLYKQLRFGGEGQHIKTCLIYLATGLLVIFSNMMNNQFTQSQVNSIAEKIELYKQKNGVYPESLEALVPRYFSRVPVARISMFSIMTKFNYGLSENNKPILQFMGHPPFGRVGYDFERKELYNYD